MTQLIQMKPPTGISQANGRSGAYYATDNAGLISVLPQDVTAFLDAGWSIDPGVYTTVVILQSDDIATLGGGIEVVPAQGAGTIVVPVFASLQLNAGTEPFANNRTVYLDAEEGFHLATGLCNGQVAEPSAIDIFQLSSDLFNLEAVVNKPIMLVASSNPDYTGSVLTSSIDTAGADYAEGDTIVIGSALITVNTVNLGAVATYTVTDAGSEFAANTSYSQDSTSGAGTGFALSVDSIAPLSNGTAKLTVKWSVINI